MEDFYYAGGLRPRLASAKLHLDAVTANGNTLGENLEGAKVYNDEVIARSITRCPRRAVWSC